MADYISREAAINALCEFCGICAKEKRRPNECEDILGSVLGKIPAADVRPVVRGKWESVMLDHERMGCRPTAYYCSECLQITWFRTFYCPNCGANMQEGINE